MTRLGVGLVYWPGLRPLVEEGLVDVLEIEPQGYWQRNLRTSGEPYLVDQAALETIAAFSLPTLVHGVGYPIGGTVPPEALHFSALNGCLQTLQPVWVSEHLSFNVARRQGELQQCGFLLPPRQTEEGVVLATRNIRLYRDAVGLPFAFETGVNYLQPRADEMPDGEFFAQIAEQAECGILLDMHNLWTNERNGRAKVADVLARLPLERVWEIHLAGGCEFHGYWLDGHCDVVPAEVIELTQDIAPGLPNLGAIVYEILPQHIERVGMERIAQELALMRRIWRARGEVRSRKPGTTRRGTLRTTAHPAAGNSSAVQWEDALAQLVAGGGAQTPFQADLVSDPGLQVLRELAFDARCGQLVSALELTSSLLLLWCGPATVLDVCRRYAEAVPPDLYSGHEALRFARYLMKSGMDAPYFREILAFETALIEAGLEGRSATVTFEHDPEVLLTAIRGGRFPEPAPPKGRYPLTIEASP